jgi:hypothetical protein
MREIELVARIEAVSKFALQLTAELEMAGLIDGPRFSERLRGPDRPHDQVELVQLTRARLADMLNILDSAREARAAKAGRPPSR